MDESRTRFATLKRQFAPRPGDDGASAATFALGEPAIDTMLGGGLARARLHEVVPGEEEDLASAAGFALMLALRAADTGSGNLFWIAEENRGHPRLHPPGLAELGADPARFLFVDTPDEAGLLRAAADAVRSGAPSVVVLAPAARAKLYGLTASRKLSLAAEAAGVTAILLRPAGDDGPSAAATRWQVTAARSASLEADAPGHPTLFVMLLRHRLGISHPGWRLVWDRDHAAFRLAAPLSGDLPAVAGERRLGGGFG
jgi:protein ImuA